MSEFIPPTSVIQIDCRAAGWQTQRARYLRHSLQEPLDYADDYVTRVLEVPSVVERMTPYLSWRKPEMATRGSVDSPSRFTIEVGRIEVDRKKLHQKDDVLTTVSVHEMVHCNRMQLFPQVDTLIENIASEGLAYYAQESASIDIFSSPREQTCLDDEIDGEQVLGLLYEEPRLYEQVDLYADEYLKNEWLYNKEDREYFHWGQRLGIWCVKSWIEDYGYTFKEVFEMPAEDMLAV